MALEYACHIASEQDDRIVMAWIVADIEAHDGTPEHNQRLVKGSYLTPYYEVSAGELSKNSQAYLHDELGCGQPSGCISGLLGMRIVVTRRSFPCCA